MLLSSLIQNEIGRLPQDQQKAILEVLTKSGLLTESGEPAKLTINNMPEYHKKFLDASLGSMGTVELSAEVLGVNFGCVAARVAEAAAVAACALVPGGQFAIGACIAAAHALADEACK